MKMKNWLSKFHKSVWLHFGAGIAIGMLFFLMSYHHFLLGWLVASGITFTAGAIIASLKESNDDFWDWADWWFTMAGAMALPIIYGIVIFVS